MAEVAHNAEVHLPQEQEGAELNLAEMFQQAENNIERKRTANLFKQLDERQLTEDEQKIIDQRVQLQRKMLAEFEKRDQMRKIRELQDVCPDLNDDTARKALELCEWKEDEAAVRISSDSAFKKRVMAGSQQFVTVEVKPAAPKPAAPRAARPRVVDASAVGQVFVGRFRGHMGPHQRATYKPPPPTTGSRSVATSAAGRSATADAAAAVAVVDDSAAAAGGVSTAAAAAAAAAPVAAVADNKKGGKGKGRGKKAAVAEEEKSPAAEKHESAAADEQPAVAEDGSESVPAAPKQKEGAKKRGRKRGVTAAESAEETVSEKDNDVPTDVKAEDEEPGGVEGTIGEDDLAFEWGPNEAIIYSQEGDVERVKIVVPDDRLEAIAEKAAEEALADDGDNVPPSEPKLYNYVRVRDDGTEEPLTALEVQQLEEKLRKQQQEAVEQPDQADVAMADAAEEVKDAVTEEAPPSPCRAAKAAAKAILKLTTERQLQRLQAMEANMRSEVLRALAREDAELAATLQTLMEVTAEESEEHAGPTKPAARKAKTPAPVESKPNTSTKRKTAQRAIPSSEPATAAAELSADVGLAVAAADAKPAGASPASATANLEPVAAVGSAATATAAAAANPVPSTANLAPTEADTATAKDGPATADAGVATACNEAAATDMPMDDAAEAGGNRKRSRRSKAVANVSKAAAAAAGADDMDIDVDEDDEFEDAAKKRGRGGKSRPATKKAKTTKAAVEPKADATAPMATAAAAVAGADAGATAAGSQDTQSAPPPPAAEAQAVDAPADEGAGNAKTAKPNGGGRRFANAISVTGHTSRGRVKQKGVKQAELIEVGSLVDAPGWHNSGYIFPKGFKARTLFRSSVDINSLTWHECEIIGEGGDYWPQPTYKVTALDRQDEPIIAKSCTGCWSGVLKRINAEIDARREAGEDLPPPPKTAIAGPEYFGMNQPEVVEAIEGLDPDHKCTVYWQGKVQRDAAAAGLPVQVEVGAAEPKPRKTPKSAGDGPKTTGAGAGKRGRGRKRDSDDECGDEDLEETYAGNRWSAVNRTERYRKRCADQGDVVTDDDNPLPGFIDPITLEVVVNPAISPFGHVMGLATWKAVLADQKRCPFTKQSLNVDQLTVLNKNNIERFQDRIIQQ